MPVASLDEPICVFIVCGQASQPFGAILSIFNTLRTYSKASAPLLSYFWRQRWIFSYYGGWCDLFMLHLEPTRCLLFAAHKTHHATHSLALELILLFLGFRICCLLVADLILPFSLAMWKCLLVYELKYISFFVNINVIYWRHFYFFLKKKVAQHLLLVNSIIFIFFLAAIGTKRIRNNHATAYYRRRSWAALSNAYVTGAAASVSFHPPGHFRHRLHGSVCNEQAVGVFLFA